jgi:PadR family transcriptional regulator PadR
MQAENVENMKFQMRKGILEYCILLILNRQRAYANDIIQLLQEARLIVVEGTLYPLLTRLKNMSLLNYQWIESNQGPPRKYYELTMEGKKLMSGLEQAWNEVVETVNHLKQQ